MADDRFSVRDRWNRAVGLKQPTVADVSNVVGGTLDVVFAGVADVLYAGGNLLVRTHPGLRPVGPEALALCVGLVLSDAFFAANALVRTKRLSTLRLLGRAVPCSAQEMLDHLRSTDPANLSVATEAKRWTVQYGAALSMQFRPDAGTTVGQDPKQSHLVLVEYYFSIAYRGLLPATLDDEPM